LNVLVADETGGLHQTRELLELAEVVLDREGLPDDSEAAIVLVDNETIAELNEIHRGKAGPTDVLSFPLEEARPGVPPVRTPDGPPLHLGDVFIAPDVVGRNAAEHGVDFGDELALVTVHGILHLLGWDHEDDDEAEAMEARERKYLAVIDRVRP